MKIEHFSFSTDEYTATLTDQSHQTLYWLNRNGYLNDDSTSELLSRMVVVPIRNHKNFGQRILTRFFGKNSQDNSFVFPITLLEDVVRDNENDKPNLTLVK